MKFNLIYIDFPWEFSARNNIATKFGQGMRIYKGMPLTDILKTAGPINDIADDNCMIASWTVGSKLDQHFKWLAELQKLDKNWRHCAKMFSWVKIAKNGGIPRALPGHYSLGATEDLFLVARGTIPVLKKGEKQVLDGRFSYIEDEVFTDTCQQPHSKKPDIVRDKLVNVFGDIPRIELFARNRAKYQDGWLAAGNEIGPDFLDIFDALNKIKLDNYV